MQLLHAAMKRGITGRPPAVQRYLSWFPGVFKQTQIEDVRSSLLPTMFKRIAMPNIFHAVFAALLRRSAAQGIAFAAAMMALPVGALEITTEQNQPFNYQIGQRVSGISTEILLAMSERSGVPMTIRLLPWARAYQSALRQPETCVYSTVRLPERESSFKWVGPLTSNTWALFARNEFNETIATIDDARPYRIGGVRMDAKAAYLKSIGFRRIDLVGDDSLNLAKLLAGRIDLWIAGLYSQRNPAEQTGSKAIKPVLIVRKVDYFLACHPGTSETALAALRKALQSLRDDGTLNAITERYADRLK